RRRPHLHRVHAHANPQLLVESYVGGSRGCAAAAALPLSAAHGPFSSTLLHFQNFLPPVHRTKVLCPLRACFRSVVPWCQATILRQSGKSLQPPVGIAMECHGPA